MKKLLFALGLCVVALTGCYETSRGEKIGVIVKCANEGFIFKTYECELIRGGMSMASGAFGKSFHFTIENKSLIPIAELALNEQREVKLDYHQEWITLWRTETHDNSFADNLTYKVSTR